MDYKQKTGKETNDNRIKIATLNNTHIAYNFEIYNKVLNKYLTIMEKDSKEYNMIFKDDSGDKSSYWTSTKFANVTQSYAAYGYNVIKGDDVYYNFLVYSNLASRECGFGVRPVI